MFYSSAYEILLPDSFWEEFFSKGAGVNAREMLSAVRLGVVPFTVLFLIIEALLLIVYLLSSNDWFFLVAQSKYSGSLPPDTFTIWNSPSPYCFKVPLYQAIGSLITVSIDTLESGIVLIGSMSAVIWGCVRVKSPNLTDPWKDSDLKGIAYSGGF